MSERDVSNQLPVSHIKPRRYKAFISYRHADNQVEGRQWGTWIHQVLESYEIPKRLIGEVNNYGEPISESIFPVFRDEDELPAEADLGSPIYRALENSDYLIVICSPRARASVYVANEILYFKKIGKAHRVLAIMIDGEPNTSLDTAKQASGYTEADECFPEPLQFEVNETGELTEVRAEPIAADFRLIDPQTGRPSEGWTSAAAYREALIQEGGRSKDEIDQAVNAYADQLKLMRLKIIAGVLGISLGSLTRDENIYLLEKERRKRQILTGVLSVMTVLGVVALIAAVVAGVQYGLANEARGLAVDQRGIAEDNARLARANEQRALEHEAKTREQLVEANHNLGLALLERARIYREQGNHFYAALTYARALDFDQLGKTDASPLLKEPEKYPHSLLAINAELWRSPVLHEINGVVSSSGRYFAVAEKWDEDGQQFVSPTVIDLNDGRVLSAMPAMKGVVNDMVFSPDETCLVSAHDNGEIRFWYWADQEMKQHISLMRNPANTLAFSPDGQSLAYEQLGEIRIVAPENHEQETRLSTRGHGVIKMLFTPDNQQLITAGNDRTVRFWDMDSGEELNRIDLSMGLLSFLKISPDGKTLFLADTDRMMIWDLVQHEEVRTFWAWEYGDFAISPNNDYVAFAIQSQKEDDTPILLYNYQTKQEIKLEGHRASIPDIAFNADSSLLVSGSMDGTIRVWDVPNGRLRQTIYGHANVIDVHFSADEKSVISRGVDKTLRAWDIATGHHVTLGPNDGPAIFSPNGQTLAMVRELRQISLFDMKTNRETKRLIGHRGTIKSMAFSPDGMQLITGSSDRSLRLWDAQTGEQIKHFTGHRGAINRVVFLPDAEQLVSSSEDKTIRVWDVRTGEVVRSISGFLTQPDLMTVGADGQVLVVVDSYQNLHSYDLSSGELLRQMEHRAAIYDLSISPDGQHVVTCGNDMIVYVWDMHTGELVHQLEGAEGSKFDVVYNKDGSRIYVAGVTVIEVWDAKTGTLLQTKPFSHYTNTQKVSVLSEHDLMVSAHMPSLVSMVFPEGLRLWDYHSMKRIVGLPAMGSVYDLVVSPTGNALLSFNLKPEGHVIDLWHIKRFEDLYQYIEKGAYRFEGLDVIPVDATDGKVMDFIQSSRGDSWVSDK